MGHPVFRIDHQRVAGIGEQFLDALDQLHAEHRRRRDDDAAGVIEQRLLKVAQRFPVHQPRGFRQAPFAAPAARAGVQHQQRRCGRQHVVPLLEMQQLVDQRVLRTGLQVMVLTLLQQVGKGLQRLIECIRVVAPALAQQIGEQGVADDALGERMAVGGLLPARGEVPVIGDIVVVEDHQRRQVGERPRGLAEGLAEGVDAFALTGVTLLLFLVQRWLLFADQRPGQRRPDQQVHGDHLGEGHQMVVGTAGGEDRFLHTAEELVAQGLVALHRRQQLGALVVADRVGVERLAVLDHGTFEKLVEQAEAGDQLVNGAQQWAGDIVDIDLVAAHQQQCRTLLGFGLTCQQAVGAEQAVIGGVVRLAAGAVEQVVDARAQDEISVLSAVVEQVRRPVAHAFRARAVDDLQVVGDALVLWQCPFERQVDQVQHGVPAQRQLLAVFVQRMRLLRLALGLQPQLQAQFAAGHQPQHQAAGLQAAQQRAGEHIGQRSGGIVWHRGGTSCKKNDRDWTVAGRQRFRRPAGADARSREFRSHHR